MNTAIRNGTAEEVLATRSGDPSQARWSNLENLIATLIDEMRNMGWMYAQAHSETKIKRPDPVMRPGIRKHQFRVISLEDARRMDPRLRDVPDEEAQAKLDQMTRGGK